MSIHALAPLLSGATRQPGAAVVAVAALGRAGDALVAAIARHAATESLPAVDPASMPVGPVLHV